jgi:hypothetical protein
LRKLSPVVLAPWTLPLIVVAIAVPIVGGFLIAGPALGLALGALAAGVLVVLAARAGFDEPIEVAAPTDRRYHLLVVAMAALDAGAATAVARAVEEGARATRSGPELGPEVVLLAPALNRPLAHWTSDLRWARLRAQERLAVSIASLAAAGIEARGEVGDTDPVQATEDSLASFPAQEVLLVEDRRADGRTLDELRRRLDRRLRRIEVGRAPG